MPASLRTSRRPQIRKMHRRCLSGPPQKSLPSAANVSDPVRTSTRLSLNSRIRPEVKRNAPLTISTKAAPLLLDGVVDEVLDEGLGALAKGQLRAVLEDQRAAGIRRPCSAYRRARSSPALAGMAVSPRHTVASPWTRSRCRGGQVAGLVCAAPDGSRSPLRTASDQADQRHEQHNLIGIASAALTSSVPSASVRRPLPPEIGPDATIECPQTWPNLCQTRHPSAPATRCRWPSGRHDEEPAGSRVHLSAGTVAAAGQMLPGRCLRVASGRGGIGRRADLGSSDPKSWGFKSSRSHHFAAEGASRRFLHLRIRKRVAEQHASHGSHERRSEAHAQGRRRNERAQRPLHGAPGRGQGHGPAQGLSSRQGAGPAHPQGLRPLADGRGGAAGAGRFDPQGARRPQGAPGVPARIELTEDKDEIENVSRARTTWPSRCRSRCCPRSSSPTSPP